MRLDIDEAAFWYDVEFQAGAAFLDAIDATFDRIAAAPLALPYRPNRTSRPGRAPVSSSRSTTTWPPTTVAR